MRKIKKHRTLIFSFPNSLFLSLYLTLAFIYLFQPNEIKTIIQYTLILIGISSYFFTKGKTQFNLYVLIIFILFLFSINFIGSLTIKNSLIPSALFTSNYFLALFLFKNKHKSVVYLILIVVFFLVFLLKFIEGNHPNRLFDDASRNWISIIMQTLSIVFYIVRYQNKEKPLIFPALLTLIVSIWAIGRAGIIGSFFLLVGIIYIRTRKLKLSYKINKIILLIGFLSILGFLFQESIEPYIDGLNLFRRFEEKGMDNSYRISMIREYLHNINFKTFILGYDYTQNIFFKSWDLNPHNSLIRLHYYTGFLGVVFILFLGVLLLVYLVKNPLYFILLSLLLMRGFTDIILFFGRYDFIIFYFIFDFLYNYQKKYRFFSLNFT
ncbi:MAG: hypothetical protein K9H26_16495 [Prolixibacteraceae bacterium]|nr:hypothetical protein [Prolixibacteraceae bacterium]